MRRFLAAGIYVLVVLLGSVGSLFAQDLSWKYAAGDTWLVTHVSETTSSTTVNGRTTKDRMQSQVDVRWKIDSVAADGAQVTQEITRLKLIANSESSSDILYDSNDPEKPTGATKDVATAVQPLIGAKVTCTLNNRGEVTNVMGADKLQSTAKSQGWVTNLLEQPLAYLPGKEVKVGDDWQRTRSLELPLGQFEQTQAFKLTAYDAEQSQADISATITMKLKAGAAKTVIKDQEVTGLIKFNPTTGRLKESETTQRLTTVTPYRGGKIIVKTNSVNRISLRNDP